MKSVQKIYQKQYVNIATKYYVMNAINNAKNVQRFFVQMILRIKMNVVNIKSN